MNFCLYPDKDTGSWPWLLSSRVGWACYFWLWRIGFPDCFIQLSWDQGAVLSLLHVEAIQGMTCPDLTGTGWVQASDLCFITTSSQISITLPNLVGTLMPRDFGGNSNSSLKERGEVACGLKRCSLTLWGMHVACRPPVGCILRGEQGQWG